MLTVVLGMLLLQLMEIQMAFGAEALSLIPIRRPTHGVKYNCKENITSLTSFIYNRSDSCCINNAVIYLYDDSASTAQSITTISIEPNVIGDEVKIELFGTSRTLNLAEVMYHFQM